MRNPQSEIQQGITKVATTVQYLHGGHSKSKSDGMRNVKAVTRKHYREKN